MTTGRELSNKREKEGVINDKRLHINREKSFFLPRREKKVGEG